ncbi:MAG: hypothetical protein AAF621_08045 [Pseudomonadota bacterium]
MVKGAGNTGHPKTVGGLAVRGRGRGRGNHNPVRAGTQAPRNAANPFVDRIIQQFRGSGLQPHHFTNLDIRDDDDRKTVTEYLSDNNRLGIPPTSAINDAPLRDSLIDAHAALDQALQASFTSMEINVATENDVQAEATADKMANNEFFIGLPVASENIEKALKDEQCPISHKNRAQLIYPVALRAGDSEHFNLFELKSLCRSVARFSRNPITNTTLTIEALTDKKKPILYSLEPLKPQDKAE